MASEIAKELVSQINAAQDWGLAETSQEAYATWLAGYLPEEPAKLVKRLRYYHANQPFIAALLDAGHPGHEHATHTLSSVITAVVRKSAIREDYPLLDQDDVIQTTFIRVLDKLPTFRHESSFTTWVHAVAINEVRDYFRQRNHDTDLKQKAQTTISKPEPMSDPTHEQTSLALLWETIHARLKADPDARLETVFVEHVLHDRRFCDIKDILGLSISRTHTLYTTACALLRQDPALRQAATDFGLLLKQASAKKRKKPPPAPPTDMREDG